MRLYEKNSPKNPFKQKVCLRLVCFGVCLLLNSLLSHETWAAPLSLHVATKDKALSSKSGLGTNMHNAYKKPSSAKKTSKNIHLLQPASPLLMLLTLRKVRLHIGVSQVVLEQEISLPKGDLDIGDKAFHAQNGSFPRAGFFRFYVALGAPGMPSAFDAYLVSPKLNQPESLAREFQFRSPVNANVLFGPAQMAGFVVTLPKTRFRDVLGDAGTPSFDQVTLRLRTLLEKPVRESDGSRSLLIRTSSGELGPLTVSEIEVVTDPHIALTNIKANFCIIHINETPHFSKMSKPGVHPSSSRSQQEEKGVESSETGGEVEKGEALFVQNAGDVSVQGSVPPWLATRRDGDSLCLSWKEKKD